MLYKMDREKERKKDKLIEWEREKREHRERENKGDRNKEQGGRGMCDKDDRRHEYQQTLSLQ